jgi:hypothetical protein
MAERSNSGPFRHETDKFLDSTYQLNTKINNYLWRREIGSMGG